MAAGVVGRGLHDRIDSDFRYHPPKDGQAGQQQAELYVELRDMAGALAHRMASVVPEGRELSTALTKLEEAVMWANAGIARHG